ncbi:MAG TPA: 1,4-dihydroxy-2-naphthoate polyprenyltransferase [Gemmatimonadaceae bacterium]
MSATTTSTPAPVAGPVRAWILAARPATLPAAAVPVMVGAAVAIAEGAPLRPLVFAVTLVAALLIQVGTNFANDYSDFQRGADHEGRLGPLRVTQSGLISQEGVRRGIVVAFGLAVLLGAWLAWVGGWPIIAIGVFSILCGLAYTGGPWPFGYHGLGDVFTFLFFGPVAVAGTAYLQEGWWSEYALLMSVPVGLLVTNILVINNLRDLPTDRLAGKHTLAVRIGDRAARAQYALFAAGAYAVPAVVALRGPAQRWLFLPWLSLPFGALLVTQVLGGLSGRALNPMLKKSGQLLLLFGILLAAGLVLSAKVSS